jgi:uncharacterized protein YkwD
VKKIFIFSILFVYLVAVYSAGRFIAINYAQKPTPVSAVTPTKQAELNADKLWSLIQEWRESEGLQPYIKDQRLCEIAKDRADDNIDYHKGFMEKYDTPEYPFVMQENSVWGYSSEEYSLNGWLNSPPHRETLEKPYTHSCVATYKNNAIQIFSNF